MGEITMPRLSDTMSEGAVGRWLKQPGDQITAGEIIAEIETDKATMELEAFESGTLQQILVPAGQTVPIGEVIGLIGDGPVAETPAPAAAPPQAEAAQPPAEDQPVASGEEQPAPAAAPQAETAQAAPAQPPASGDENGRVIASPVARRLAEELGINLHQVTGTGPGGRIIKENVEAYAAQGKPETGAAATEAPAAAAPAPVAAAPKAPAPAAPPAAPVAAALTPLSRMRKAIARAMTEAKPGVPHIYVTLEVAMDAAMALREQLNANLSERISINDIVVKAAAKALVLVPAVNTSLVTDPQGQPAIAQQPNINVGVAVALEEGLLAVVVRDADKKSLSTISSEIRAMVGRAREGKLKQPELEGATFQVTNLGMFEISEFGSIITVPQAASLAVGAVRKVPVVKDDQLSIGQVMKLTLSADHRIVDGAVAATYLKALKGLLEAPLSILV